MTDFPIKVRMSAAALSELRECEYGSYEDHIHSDGDIGEIREEEYGKREFGDHGDYLLHIVEIIDRSPYKTVVELRNQHEVDEFFAQTGSGTFSLHHPRICLRIYDELLPLVSDNVPEWIRKSPRIGF